MKIKSLIYALLIFGGVVSLGSCQNDVNDPLPVRGRTTINIASFRSGNRNKVEVRAAGNIPFFENGNDITVRSRQQDGKRFCFVPYTYNNGTFPKRLKDRFLFLLTRLLFLN